MKRPVGEPRRPLLGLVRRREVILPTARGWVVLVIVCLALMASAIFGVYPFLSVTDSLPGGVLAVEGWGSEDAMRDVLEEFDRHHYDGLFVTGGPIEKSSPLFEFKTFAELGAITLQKIGADPRIVQAVPAPKVRQDRTYASAVALRKWLREHGHEGKAVNVVSMGPHSRRTRLLFQKAFGDSARVGIIASEARDFDSRRWWNTSEGVRAVIAESIAYVYARFIFRTPGD